MKSKETNGTKPHPVVVNPEHSRFELFIFRSVLPLFLMFFSPNLVIVLWFTATKCDGSFTILFERVINNGLWNGLSQIWTDIHIASPLAVYTILGYMLFAIILMIFVPGPRSEGPVTPKGNIPVYKDNGFSCYIITSVVFWVLAISLKIFTSYSVTIVYDRFDEFLGTLTVFSHLLCIFLHLKGLLYPSSTDCGTTGNYIFDYYWGTELYPRVFGIDIKVFTNCRFGMTVWALLVYIFTLKNYETFGFVDGVWVSAVLQVIYFTKFFWWESGYMCTIDIMLDRAGFYICWGCLAFIPGLYASVSMFLASHSHSLGLPLAAFILALGVSSCLINYWADEQKQTVRRSDGKCLIWGKEPKIIRAKYRIDNGLEKSSILLVSGFWSLSRHFHYVPEILLAVFWSVPAGYTCIMPYVYVIWLSMLLVHRTFRDDTKCRIKYGRYWDEYCREVPYKIIPYVF